MNTTTHPPIAPVLTLLRGGRIEGELPIVTKGPIDHLAPEDIVTIHEAELLHVHGREAEAKAMIAALELKLGVTPADKAAAFAPSEPWEGDLLAALGAEQKEDPPLAIPHNPRDFNDPELSNIDSYDQIRTIAKARGNRKGVSQAEGAMAKIAQRRDHRVDVKERHDGIAETVALAKNRGEEVDEKPATGGAAHMISRDALAHMKTLGHITGAQFAAGMAYRQAFEARGTDLQASQISDTGGGKGHDNDAFVRRKRLQAEQSVFAKECEVAVRKATMVEHLSALQMLQWVAGMGRSMRDFGGGRAFERNKAALGAALDVVLGLREAARIETPAA